MNNGIKDQSKFAAWRLTPDQALINKEQSMSEATENRGTRKSLVDTLVVAVKKRAPLDAVYLLQKEPDAIVSEVLNRLPFSLALRILSDFPEERSENIALIGSSEVGQQWTSNHAYPEDSVGRLMEKPVAVFNRDTTVSQATDEIRRIVADALITYAYVVESDNRLCGVVVMRDLLLADDAQTLGELMIPEPFFFTPEVSVADAMQATLRRHYPVYPVCDQRGELIGLVSGHAVFEENTYELTAQTGRMVGIDKEEHLHTHFLTSLKYRHPWLQLNLMTAFLAAFVVGMFEDTISRIVMLAVFLPVLAGQSGNTGSQSLAITLRGMTLGEMTDGMFKKVALKEIYLGLANGFLVGITASIAMYAYATWSNSPLALSLAMIVLMAMVGSCVISGLTGVLVPLGLKRLGADPTTASAIFLTTATDVVSMGMFLGFATVMVL